MRRFALLLLIGSLFGCAGIRQLVMLRQVAFRFDRISEPHVAGILLSGIRSPQDLNPVDLGRLTLAVASKNVPLELTVHVIGTNPDSNKVTAKLIGLDWSYIVDGQEAVRGKVSEAYEFPPGQGTDMALPVTFNLMEFFGGNAGDLLETALDVIGRRPSTHTVTMELRPVIDTPLGPMSYPTPIELQLVTAGK